MTTIVMVHGAWGGSYGFRHVRQRLAAAGHEPFTPSLTGVGERSHLAGPHVNLSMHIRDVYNTVFYEDLHDIVLLGFSYGGMVVTGLLDSIGSRVRHLVYLDAMVPRDGQAAVDVFGGDASALLERAVDGGVPPIPRELDTPEATAWSDARRVNQPIGTLTEPVKLSVPIEERAFTRTFIKATADPNELPDSAFWRAARHAQESPLWEYHAIVTNHMVPLTRPDDLTAILLDLAAR